MNGFQKIEKKLSEEGFRFIAGTDEAGRGPLAGPVVAASVIFPQNVKIKGINDSKKLSPKVRLELEEEIKSKALAYSIYVADVKVIDEMNILRASIFAMERSIENLKILPEIILVDGNRKLSLPMESRAVIKGDQKCFSIAAASILAKNFRDRLMYEYAKFYPHYKFENNKGYPTRQHIEAILKYGPCEIHRKKFLRKIYEKRFVQQEIEF